MASYWIHFHLSGRPPSQADSAGSRKATVSNGVLCLLGPELIADEWEARFVAEH